MLYLLICYKLTSLFKVMDLQVSFPTFLHLFFPNFFNFIFQSLQGKIWTLP